MKTPIANPLALAVLALLFERPMHPYEMAAILKQRHKHESIKLRYGSLYAVIDLLTARGFIEPVETSRGGRRPERTTYSLTSSGRACLRDWMHELLAEPAKEFPQFEAGLCLLPVLPPDETVTLLRHRAARLAETIAQMKLQLATMAAQDLSVMVGPEEKLPPPLLGRKFPAIFLIENEYRLAMLSAELEFVSDLVRRITEEGWGPVELWRDIQATCEKGYRERAGQPDHAARERNEHSESLGSSKP
ncbi:PadR family transcriptional regulator [Bradyrhizobium sp.]|uniref:PadR family transcriptional regulator n=1 Tax=Bradyrhizobium sp. TaxID=376 RepID=UPI0025BE26CD|nr:PadR family transcriptional regulator [Bradyrhizobium sp.]